MPNEIQKKHLMHYYKLYKHYCTQLHLVPCQFENFHMNLYYQMRILANSHFGK